MTGDDRFARYPSLAGRVAFVSGGATGLGARFVERLADQGARVAFVDLDEEAGRSLADAVESSGAPRPWFAPVDVTATQRLRSAIDDASRALGPITVLVNNAANDTRHEVLEVDEAFWDERMAVNVRHHYFAAQAVLPQMRAAGGGSIINLGSISAHIDLVDMSVYIAAKAAVEGLTRTLAREWGPFGVRVNCVIPGWVMTKRQLDNWVDDEVVERITRMQSIPELLHPDDVARLVLWLAADDSRLCTAQNWIVDGGWM